MPPLFNLGCHWHSKNRISYIIILRIGWAPYYHRIKMDRDRLVINIPSPRYKSSIQCLSTWFCRLRLLMTSVQKLLYTSHQIDCPTLIPMYKRIDARRLCHNFQYYKILQVTIVRPLSTPTSVQSSRQLIAVVPSRSNRLTIKSNGLSILVEPTSGKSENWHLLSSAAVTQLQAPH